MSNKPKGVKRLTEYNPNKAERRHKLMVLEAKKQGFKHPGSKSINALSRIIPTSVASSTLRRLLHR